MVVVVVVAVAVVGGGGVMVVAKFGLVWCPRFAKFWGFVGFMLVCALTVGCCL